MEEDLKKGNNGELLKKRASCPIGLVWELHLYGESYARWAGARVVLMNPDREKLRYALRFEFKASNNEVEYKALIVGLELARKLEVKNLRIHNSL